MAHRLHRRIPRTHPHISSHIRPKTLHLPIPLPQPLQDPSSDRSAEALHGSHGPTLHQARIRDNLHPQIQFEHHAMDKHLQE